MHSSIIWCLSAIQKIIHMIGKLKKKRLSLFVNLTTNFRLAEPPWKRRKNSKLWPSLSSFNSQISQKASIHHTAAQMHLTNFLENPFLIALKDQMMHHCLSFLLPVCSSSTQSIMVSLELHLFPHYLHSHPALRTYFVVCIIKFFFIPFLTSLIKFLHYGMHRILINASWYRICPGLTIDL